MNNTDKTYAVYMLTPQGIDKHLFNAVNPGLAKRAALIKYPYKTVKSVEEVK